MGDDIGKCHAPDRCLVPVCIIIEDFLSVEEVQGAVGG